MASASSSSAAAGKGTAYDSMEIHELRQALREKGLNASGTKAQLLKRVASFEISREVSQRCGRPGPLHGSPLCVPFNVRRRGWCRVMFVSI